MYLPLILKVFKIKYSLPSLGPTRRQALILKLAEIFQFLTSSFLMYKRMSVFSNDLDLSVSTRPTRFGLEDSGLGLDN